MISSARLINYRERAYFLPIVYVVLFLKALYCKKAMISREEARDIAEIPGNIRGSALLSDIENIKRRVGVGGLEKVKRMMEGLGYPLEYENIKAMAWYPLGLRPLSFMVIQELFGWGDEDFREMGDHAPKYSFIIKMMVKFLASPEAAIRRAPEYWKKYYSVGTLKVGELSEEKREVAFYLRDFKTIPLYCRYLEGFFRRLMQYLRPGDDVHCEEKRCELQGEECHEFRLSW